jgi:chromosome segregation ATPase
MVVVPARGCQDMSEVRFARIESRLDDLSEGQKELRRDVAVLKTDVAVLKTDVAVLKTDVAVLKTDVAELKTDVGQLKTDVVGLRGDVQDLKTGQDDLRRYIGVLHEEVLDRIQTLAFDPTPLRREFQAGIAGLREELVQRIEPLEAALLRKRRQ